MDGPRHPALQPVVTLHRRGAPPNADAEPDTARGRPNRAERPTSTRTSTALDPPAATAFEPRRPGRPRRQPHGRDDVVAALLAATRELVAGQPYETVTVRQVATRAGVNHALIYRYFGSKERMLWAAMNEVAWEMAGLLRADPSVRDVVPAMHLGILERADWMRSLAQLLMAGSTLEGYERLFPTLRGLRKLVEREQEAAGAADGPDPAVVVATATAASAGWILIRGFLVEALELEDRDGAELDGEVADLLGRWVAGSAGSPERRDDP